MAGKTEKKSFEKSLERLNVIADKLEEGDATLDESLALYEEGIGLLKACNEALENAEKKLESIKKGEKTDD